MLAKVVEVYGDDEEELPSVELLQPEKMTDAQVRRARDMAIVRMRKKGYTPRQTRIYFGLSESYIRRRKRKVPKVVADLACQI